jgi:hypothetical protein
MKTATLILLLFSSLTVFAQLEECVPTCRFAGKSSGTVPLAKLTQHYKLSAIGCPGATVVSFQMVVITGGQELMMRENSNQLTYDMQMRLKALTGRGKLYFEDIMVRQNGVEKRINSLVFSFN